MLGDKQFPLRYQIPTNSLLNFINVINLGTVNYEYNSWAYRRFKHILGGLYSEGLIFGGHFVLVSANQDYKIYYHKEII